MAACRQVQEDECCNNAMHYFCGSIARSSEQSKNTFFVRSEVNKFNYKGLKLSNGAKTVCVAALLRKLRYLMSGRVHKHNRDKNRRC